MTVTTCAGSGTEHFQAMGCDTANVAYQGATLATYEANGYDDSDFYAVVWDEETQAVKTVCYASTRGWTYHNSATVDATDAVKAKAVAFYVPQFAQARADAVNADEATPSEGKRVKVVKGRKVAKGTEGEVFWVGADKYARRSQWSAAVGRVGFKTDAGEKFFTSADNVEVVGATTHTAEEFTGQVNTDQINFATAARSLAYSALASVR